MLGPAIAALHGRGFAGPNIFAAQGTLWPLSRAASIDFSEHALAELLRNAVKAKFAEAAVRALGRMSDPIGFVVFRSMLRERP